MTSFSRIVTAPVIYAGLAVGALITLAPLALGLLTSVTSAEQFDTAATALMARWPPTECERRRWGTPYWLPACSA